MSDQKKLTTNAGAPVVDNQNIMTAGPRGPALLQDVWFLEKLAHFDREVIPERRMHAKGSGAYGTFTVTHDITKYTKAKIFLAITTFRSHFASSFASTRNGTAGTGWFGRIQLSRNQNHPLPAADWLGPYGLDVRKGSSDRVDSDPTACDGLGKRGQLGDDLPDRERALATAHDAEIRRTKRHGWECHRRPGD